MLFKLSTVAALVSAASALALDTPTDWKSGGPVNVTWSTSATDPSSFSVELNNNGIFNNNLALANNIDPARGSITFQLPIVPAGPGYSLQAVNVSDIGQVYDHTGDFAIASAPSSVASTASSASLTLVSSTPSGSASVTSSGSSSSGSSSAGSSSGASSSGASSSGAPSPSPSQFNGNGAATFGVSWAVVALGAVAGAALGL